MKKVEPGNIITLYIGPTEITINASTRITKTYYSAGAQMVAMRVVTSTGGNTLYYVHSDHLGSTSLMTCGSGCGTAGTLIAGSRQSYYPYGAVRTAASSLPTDITFTGQRSDASTGLMFYNARYYSPVVGRFVSADTIVPGASNPQAWNRYSYVVNNPLKYTDPSGHCPWCIAIAIAIGLLSGCSSGPAPVSGPTPVLGVAVPDGAVHVEHQYGAGQTRTVTGNGGTMIAPNLLLTHGHYAPQLGTANNDELILNDGGNPAVHVALNSGNVKEADDETTLVTLPNNMNTRTAQLASQQDIGALKAGDILRVTYWDDPNSKLAAGDFTIQGINKTTNQATLYDPNVRINSGDSGSGVFFKGGVVGNITSINWDAMNNKPLGSFNVNLLPSNVP